MPRKEIEKAIDEVEGWAEKRKLLFDKKQDLDAYIVCVEFKEWLNFLRQMLEAK